MTTANIVRKLIEGKCSAFLVLNPDVSSIINYTLKNEIEGLTFRVHVKTDETTFVYYIYGEADEVITIQLLTDPNALENVIFTMRKFIKMINELKNN